MSYDDWPSEGLTELEKDAGIGWLLYGKNDEECRCGRCMECEYRQNFIIKLQENKIEESLRFKEAAKLIAGLDGNKKIKQILINKLRKDSLDSAILRYMIKENLPPYYADIIRSDNCIEKLIEGIFYRVCKLRPSHSLNKQIKDLSHLTRDNPNRITAYDRVGKIQKFIHFTIDDWLGSSMSQSIPVKPMRNALSAARLHLNIIDISDPRTSYGTYLDTLSTASVQFEYDEPRPPTVQPGKRTWPRWRVRHLRPLSYYFAQNNRARLNALIKLDENSLGNEFAHAALLIYSRT